MAWIRVLALLTAVALPVTLVLCVPLSHDEHMYVAAGTLLGEHTLYADSAYLQAPYLRRPPGHPDTQAAIDD